MFKLPHIKLAGFKKAPARTSTGSGATALNTQPKLSPGLAQGSGGLQASEAISYGTVPLQYAKPEVPHKVNVGVPIHQNSRFVVPAVQRASPPKKAKVSSK